MATLSNLNPSVAEFTPAVQNLHKCFMETPVDDINQIKAELRSILASLVKHKDSICKALLEDFHRSVQETIVMEYSCLVSEINYLIKNIGEILAPDSPEEKAPAFSTLAMSTEKISLGVVLIVVPFNYPLILSMSPLVGALAAGNNVVLKLPYDKCPQFSLELTRMLLEAVSPDRLSVVNGGINENQALLNMQFDKILFTGSGRVGKIVMEKAAKYLTPTILELGGKSPTFITGKCMNLRTAASRLVWGKFCNAGQTCVAPDYLLLEDSVYDDALVAIREAVNEMFPAITPESDFTHVIDDASFRRLSGYLKSTKGELLVGGKTDASSRFIAPTVVTGVDFDDALMQDELFGPILPVIKYSDLSKAIDDVRRTHDTPLALYIFSDSKEEQEQVRIIRSGGMLINDVMLQAGNYSTPFGGVGTSGYGRYHGRYTVESFVHHRATLKQPGWAEMVANVRYAPYNYAKVNNVLRLMKLPAVPVISVEQILKYIVVMALGMYIGKGLPKA